MVERDQRWWLRADKKRQRFSGNSESSGEGGRGGGGEVGRGGGGIHASLLTVGPALDLQI
jgi:hypothetical protein